MGSEGYLLAIQNAKYIIGILIFLGLLGVLFHLWLSKRLSFYNFEDKNSSKKKKGVKRIIIPWLTVCGMSVIVPYVIVFSKKELLNVIMNNEKDFQYITFPWNFILPRIIAWEVPILTCFILTSLFYFVWGGIFWFVWKISFKLKYGR